MMHLKVQLVVGILLIATCRANNNLQTKYEWKLIDFNYETAAALQNAISNRTFIPENVIPVGIDIDDNRLFISLPRLKAGVPASLATINLNELTETKSPLLKPYPSWQSHQVLNANDKPDIISPFHIKIDNCRRLWTIDSGLDGALSGEAATHLAPARILIFDLQSDYLIRAHELPTMNSNKTIFSNIAVDDDDCENTFAYVADASVPSSLVVYSYKSNESWQVKHHYFNIDPLAGSFNVSGIDYRTTVGLYGLALSEKRSNGFPDLYFHALTSLNEFNVSTAILRNKTAGEHYKDFSLIGTRALNEQAGSSIYDRSTNMIFYTLPNMNAIGCWKATSKIYNVTAGSVFSSATEMEYPIDVKVDKKERLWTLSNSLNRFVNGELDGNKVNFHIHFAPIKDAIKATACERGFIENVVNKFNKVLRKDGNSSSMNKSTAVFTIIGTFMLWMIHSIAV